ncbi:50S ribosomal protein L20 [Thiohalorhabdus sp.]|uniref:50S ribosomal protein L20 n=1 Tax=Thiohalorhabdus sp. TaxID=3094134 RepID=UPI002FC34B46
MPRIKRGVQSHRRHKKILKQAKGFHGRKKNCFRVANEFVGRAAQYQYRDRKQRKRDFRRLWVIRINAAARQHGLSYSRFISGLRQAGVGVDRKVLADLAVRDKAAFAQVAQAAKDAESA